METVLADLQARIRTAAAVQSPLVIRGGGTKDFFGQVPAGAVLDTTSCVGILDYDPTELVITARAVTPLAAIERSTRASAQMLPCEPPHFGARATLGGAVSVNWRGRPPSKSSIWPKRAGAKYSETVSVSTKVAFVPSRGS